MPNHLALATLTKTLQSLLTDEIGREIPDLTVTLQRPDAPAGNPPKARINIYLYQFPKFGRHILTLKPLVCLDFFILNFEF